MPLRLRILSHLNLLLKISLFIFIFSLIYILWGALFGPLKTFGDGLPMAAQHRIMQNVRLFALILQVSGTVAAVLLALSYYQESSLVGGLLAGGLLFYLGLPYLMVPDELPPLLGSGTWTGVATKPVITLIMASRELGSCLLLFGVISAVVGAVEGTRDSFRRPRRVATARHRSPLMKGGRWWAKCYQTPFRREGLCAICPRLEERRACWKVKSGCYCDERIVLGQTRAGLARGEVINPAFLQIETNPSGRNKQLISCGVCPIYLYHQQQKYNIAAPALAVGALAAFWYYAKALTHGYRWLVVALDRVALRLSFSPDSAHARSVLYTALDHPVVEWLVIGSVGLLLLCYSIQALEVMIFKWKL